MNMLDVLKRLAELDSKNPNVVKEQDGRRMPLPTSDQVAGDWGVVDPHDPHFAAIDTLHAEPGHLDTPKENIGIRAKAYFPHINEFYVLQRYETGRKGLERRKVVEKLKQDDLDRWYFPVPDNMGKRELKNHLNYLERYFGPSGDVEDVEQDEIPSADDGNIDIDDTKNESMGAQGDIHVDTVDSTSAISGRNDNDDPSSLTRDDLETVEHAQGLEGKKEAASKLIDKISHQTTPEKLHKLKRSLEHCHKESQILALVWNIFLSGEGEGVIGEGYNKFEKEVELAEIMKLSGLYKPLAECYQAGSYHSPASINMTASSGEELTGMIKSLMGMHGAKEYSPDGETISTPVSPAVTISKGPSMQDMLAIVGDETPSADSMNDDKVDEVMGDEENRMYDSSPHEKRKQDPVRQFGDIDNNHQNALVGHNVRETTEEDLYREYQNFIAEGNDKYLDIIKKAAERSPLNRDLKDRKFGGVHRAAHSGPDYEGSSNKRCCCDEKGKSECPIHSKKKVNEEHNKELDKLVDEYARHVLLAHTGDAQYPEGHTEEALYTLKKIRKYFGDEAVRYAKNHAQKNINDHQRQSNEIDKARVKANYKPTSGPAYRSHSSNTEEGRYDYYDDDNYSDYDDGPGLPSGYCTNCGKKCDGIPVDNSFDYDYGSISGKHEVHDLESDCCGADMVKDYDDLPDNLRHDDDELAEGKKWVKQAVKGIKKGALRKQEGKKKGEKFSKDELKGLAKSGTPKERKRAQFALNISKK